MDTIKIPEQIDQPRRRFFGTAALMIAAAQLAFERFCRRAAQQDKGSNCACDQAGDEHLVRPAEAD